METLFKDVHYAIRGLLRRPALLLATIGLYGVMSYAVVQRTRESEYEWRWALERSTSWVWS